MKFEGILKFILSSFLSVSMVLMFSGCETATRWPEFSGFLGNYKGMYRSDDIEGIFVVKDEAKEVIDYSKFLIDPVTVYLTKDTKAYSLGRDQLAEISRNFRKSLNIALQRKYTVVDKPAKDVLRIKAAITDVLKIRKDGDVLAIVEVDFVESKTEERVAAILTSQKGMLLSELTGILESRLDYLSNKTKIMKFE